jgi:hypothetical protein
MYFVMPYVSGTTGGLVSSTVSQLLSGQNFSWWQLVVAGVSGGVLTGVLGNIFQGTTGVAPWQIPGPIAESRVAVVNMITSLIGGFYDGIISVFNNHISSFVAQVIGHPNLADMQAGYLQAAANMMANMPGPWQMTAQSQPIAKPDDGPNEYWFDPMFVAANNMIIGADQMFMRMGMPGLPYPGQSGSP